MEVHYEPTEGQKKRAARNYAMCERYIELARTYPLANRPSLKRKVATEFGLNYVSTLAILKKRGL